VAVVVLLDEDDGVERLLVLLLLLVKVGVVLGKVVDLAGGGEGWSARRKGAGGKKRAHVEVGLLELIILDLVHLDELGRGEKRVPRSARDRRRGGEKKANLDDLAIISDSSYKSTLGEGETFELWRTKRVSRERVKEGERGTHEDGIIFLDEDDGVQGILVALLDLIEARVVFSLVVDL
jgi:hypothetical protein